MKSPHELRQALAAVAALVDDQELLASAVRTLASGIGAGGPPRAFPKTAPAPRRAEHKPAVARGGKLDRAEPSRTGLERIPHELHRKLRAAVASSTFTTVAKQVGVSHPVIQRVDTDPFCTPATMERLVQWGRTYGGEEPKVAPELASAVRSAALRRTGSIDASAIAEGSGASLPGVQALLDGGAVSGDDEDLLLEWITSV